MLTVAKVIYSSASMVFFICKLPFPGPISNLLCCAYIVSIVMTEVVCNNFRIVANIDFFALLMARAYCMHAVT